jgi:plasmid stabilization system protein ParE
VTSYQVVFTPEAREEALAAAEYIASQSSGAACRWYADLEQAILSLSSFPHRCSVARESEYLGQELRQILHYSHRIIFRVEEPTRIVRILHVRHSSQRAIGEPPVSE